MWRLLFPLMCPSCAAPCRELCPSCRHRFPPRVGSHVPSGLDALWCRFSYDGAVKNLVLASKATAAHGWLEVMAGQLVHPSHSSHVLAPPRELVVTWATGSVAHRRRRGYDPAERLARRYARLHGFGCRELLLRVGGPQEGRTAKERSALRFQTRQRVLPNAQRTVLVVDDVVTTGASMSRAAEALRQAGAHTVIGVAFAQSGWGEPDRNPS